MKLNKQDPLVQNVIVPVIPELPNDPVLSIAIQSNGQVKEKGKEKEKEKVEKLIGREVRKKFQNYGYFIGKERSFDDPYYKIIYSDGDEEKMARSSIFQYLIDLENKNASAGLRKRKDVVIGGQIHHVHY